MKKLYFIILLLISVAQSNAQTTATTRDGRKVILYDNGRWRYADRNNNDRLSTDYLSLYEEAYKYAYDIVYADEFFSTEKRNKANDWAKDYVFKNIYIPIGNRSLEDWCSDLNSFANDKLFTGIFFSTDRSKAASAWVGRLLMEKAYFEDYNLSIIERHRMAYDAAYKYIFANEFFDTDRRKKALQWANDFVRG